MKKILALTLAALMLLSLTPVLAEEAAPVVYVTIANGEIVLPCQAVELTDADNDGALTIADALYLAHEAAFEGGAEAGFACENTEYGLSLTKLWGVDNGGAFGYYVNDAMAMSLADPIEDGAYVNAFVYTDTAAYSDAYSFFDVKTAAEGDVTLTLSSIGFDENYAPVVNPVAGATITVNGEKTDAVTDENGQATVTVKAGDVISAVSDTATLVPPCCVVAEAAEEKAAA